ncbi:MAG: hypothetical protein HFH49_02565 [Lachnospiraceae bacterium]|nr:hypothetical protein [Lachnospiraceae bacterium]
MKIHFLKEDALIALKTNISLHLKYYKNPTNDWLYEYFEGNNPFMEYQSELEEFSLVADDADDLGKQDVKNVIVLYSAMKSLSDTQVTDERLWAGLCHGDLWNYLHKRFHMGNSGNNNEKDIKARYFFGHNKKRSLIVNPLSKLWWIGRLTYDKDKKDPFELTKYLENDFATKSLVIFSNNYMGNHNISIALLSALSKLEKEDFEIKGRRKREVYYEATRYLNVLGGTYVLDYFTKGEIEDKVKKYLKSLN